MSSARADWPNMEAEYDRSARARLGSTNKRAGRTLVARVSADALLSLSRLRREYIEESRA